MNFIDFIILIILGGLALYIVYLKIKKVVLSYKVVNLQEEDKMKCSKACESCVQKNINL